MERAVILDLANDGMIVFSKERNKVIMFRRNRDVSKGCNMSKSLIF